MCLIAPEPASVTRPAQEHPIDTTGYVVARDRREWLRHKPMAPPALSLAVCADAAVVGDGQTRRGKCHDISRSSFGCYLGKII